MEQIILNLIPKGLPPICHASQYDKGREIRLVIMDGLQGYYFTDETVELEVRKPDNNVVTAAVDVIQGNSYVDIVTTEQMTACEGDNLCELVIYKGDIRVGSLNFKMRIEVDPLKDGIKSETEIHNLTTQIQDINEQIVPDMVAEEVANQYDSQNVIFDDEPTENHGIGYAVKSAGLKAYIPKAIDELDDVEINNPQANQAIVYNPITRKFENGEVSTVGSIDDLDDVDTTGKAEGDSLRYNGTEWVAQPTTVKLTLAEYNALTEKAPNTRYIITDAPALEYTAEDLSYDGGTETTKQKIDEKAEIDDTTVENSKTWSSNKLMTEFRTATTGTISAGTNCTIRVGHLYKRNNVVYCDFAINKSDDISSRTTIGNLPAGFRPSGGSTLMFMISGSTNINGLQNRATPLLITTGGDLIVGDLILPSGTIKEVTGCISFIV